MEKLRQEFEELIKKSLHKYANILKSINSTGDNLVNAKNCRACFDFHDIENSAHLFRGFSLKDSYDIDLTVMSELVYEYTTSGRNNYLVRFAVASSQGCNDTFYSDYCASLERSFGCVGLRNKQYCILNKQYTKEEYEKLVPKIIQHMNDMPYTDKKGRVYKYGEFFPPELSPFAYNETIAQEYFPLTKEQAQEQGYKWKDPEPRTYQPDLTTDQLPDHIRDVDDSIIGKVIQCSHSPSEAFSEGGRQPNCNEQCTTAFKIIEPELQFYKRMNLPLPRLCPNCRHYQRLKQRNPLKLWHRSCMCQGKISYEVEPHKLSYHNTVQHFHGDSPCSNEFETSYSPERSEIVYCEKCYQAEVV